MKKYKVIKPYKDLKEYEILIEGHELYHTRPMEFRNNSVLYFKKEEIENNKEYFKLTNWDEGGEQGFDRKEAILSAELAGANCEACEAERLFNDNDCLKHTCGKRAEFKALEKTYLENVKHEEEEWNKTHNIGGNDQDVSQDYEPPAMTNKKPSWEEEFKQLYEVKIIDEYGSIFKQNLKHFIRRTIKTERADERMKVRDECYTWADDAVKQAGKEHQELIEFLQKERNELVEKLKIAKKQAVKEENQAWIDGFRCLNCGRTKPYDALCDTCDDCLENN